MMRLTIGGSTGSIGTQTLEVADAWAKAFVNKLYAEEF